MTRSLVPGFFLLCTSAVAQEQLGIANSNYAGTDAVPLNPARMATQWPYMDINLIGANVFAWNDYVFLSRNEHSFWSDLNAGIKAETGEDFVVHQSLAPGRKEGFEMVAVKGPAVAVSLGAGRR